MATWLAVEVEFGPSDAQCDSSDTKEYTPLVRTSKQVYVGSRIGKESSRRAFKITLESRTATLEIHIDNK
jgi:hypothetical protein